MGVLPTHSAATSPLTHKNLYVAYNSHHELVVAAAISATSGKPPERCSKVKIVKVPEKPTEPLFDMVAPSKDGKEHETLMVETKAGDTSTTKLGVKTLSDVTAIDGTSLANEVTSMGESSFTDKKTGDKAHGGSSNSDGASHVKAIYMGEDIISLKTTKPAEEV